jgi:hypothetical protein
MIVSHWPTTMIGVGGEEINSVALHTVHFSGFWVVMGENLQRAHWMC